MDLDQNLNLNLNQDIFTSHLQLHADVLSVLAEFIQGADGRLHMAAVFPVDQQPDTRTYAQMSTSSLSRTSRTCGPGLPLFKVEEDLVKVLGTSVVDRVLDFQQ